MHKPVPPGTRQPVIYNQSARQPQAEGNGFSDNADLRGIAVARQVSGADDHE